MFRAPPVSTDVTPTSSLVVGSSLICDASEQRISRNLPSRAPALYHRRRAVAAAVRQVASSRRAPAADNAN